MKFARYLEETQTPEWKKAYIDYRGLKKRITAIRREQEGSEGQGSSGEDPLLSHNPSRAPSPSTRRTSTSDRPRPSLGSQATSDLAGPSKSNLRRSRSFSSDEEENRQPSGEFKASGSVLSVDDDDERATAGPDASTSLRSPPIDRVVETDTAGDGGPYAPNTQGMPILAEIATGHQSQAVDPQAGAYANEDVSAPRQSVESLASRLRRSLTSPVLVSSPSDLPSAPLGDRSRQRGRSGTLMSIAQSFAGLRQRHHTSAISPSTTSKAGDNPPQPGTLARHGSWFSSRTGHRGHTFQMRDNPPMITLNDILSKLTPTQKKFFEKLDAELNKVESFYLDREKEYMGRSTMLKEQLQELKDHRRLFYEAHPIDNRPWTERLVPLVSVASRVKSAPAATGRSLRDSAGRAVRARKARMKAKRPSSSSEGSPASPPELTDGDRAEEQEGDGTGSQSTSRLGDTLKTTVQDIADVKASFKRHSALSKKPKYDPDYYKEAQKKLKKAVLEHYRALEMLNDYRILNLTGFRKALKKFEKVSRIRAQDVYLKEKVDPSAFASGDAITAMMKEMEDLFAARFARGDKKKAMNRLRGAGWRTNKTHHFSTWRSGFMLGLAVHALVSGIYQSYQSDTRAAIPAWPALLYTYGTLLLPTVFVCMVALNVAAWANSRINYVFIFELDVRTKMDHREVFELPCFFLATLCYAFWLSFARIGEHTVNPTTWPALWLLLVAVLTFNPLPLFGRSARWWFLRIMGHLLAPGTKRVEFSDFWMGDQFCSLSFSLANLYFIGCWYHRGWGPEWRTCMAYKTTASWVVPMMLASLPLLSRLIQSIKRWVDSRLLTHLINAGKYGAGIVAFGCYYNWRHHGTVHDGSFGVYISFMTVNALYAGSWDLLMDWSLLRPHTRYRFLRPELLWPHRIPFYYLAIVTNILGRFIWLFYLSSDGPNFMLRTFIAAIVEIFRRWQWNFYRLENEHLGNMDQYRVTREVPLPYRIEDMGHESDGDEDDEKTRRMWRRRSRSMNRSAVVNDEA